MTIEHSYLVWAGTEHYPTFEHLLDEIKRMGFSKRLPGASMGRSLLQPNTVVYLAHDNGKTEECKACLRLITCPDCRLRKHAIKALEKELEEFRAQFVNAAAIEKSGYAKRTVAIRTRKLEKAKAEIASCVLCKGEGKAKLGSGGTVKLKDGKTWDYRTYNYWMRQPEKFDSAQVLQRNMCEECGGRGCLPRGYVHGALVVDAVEYQTLPGERAADLVDMDDFTIIKAGAAARLSGEREPGGFYAISKSERNPKAIGVANSLTAAKVIPKGRVEIHGSFIHFAKPLALPMGTKRFRGVSSYAPKAARNSVAPPR